MPRKVILGFGISIDGYIARRNGAMDYLTIDQEGEQSMADFFAGIDTTIMGRKTAAATAEMRKSGEIPDMPGMSTYVFSRRWKPGRRDGLEVVNGSLTAFVRKLKRRKGKDIYLGGGGELCRSFLQADLVDEIFLGLGPVLLGDGIPAFPPTFPQRDFKLTECKSYSNGSVGLRYERIRSK
jgi:dihydrofolate reductase